MNHIDKLRVLLVEDNEEDAMTTGDLLDQAAGEFEVVWVSTRDNAPKLIGSLDFDVCLIHFRLDASSAVDLVSTIRSQNLRVPCILLTEVGDAEIDRAALTVGAADYLVKSELTPELLARTIRYTCRQAAMLAELAETEAQTRSLIDGAPDGIALLNASGSITAANLALQRLTGLNEDDLCERPLTDLFVDDADAQSAVRRALTGAGTPALRDVRSTLGLGQSAAQGIPIELSLSSWERQDQRFWTVIVHDITEREVLLGELQRQAYHDAVTGLPNRLMFMEAVEERLDAAEITGDRVTLVFLDLDDFKRVNDSHGHAVGDIMLQQVGERLKGCVRAHDVVARFGGDEFAVCASYPEGEGDLSRLLGARVVDRMSEPFIIGSRQLDMTCSVGVVVHDSGTESAEALTRYADVAMYEAKQRGKNTVALFEDNMHRTLLERMRLEQDLAEGLENDQFVLSYQPLVRTDTSEVIGFEGLCRWVHPTLGWLAPNRFIPMAEACGRIDAIGSFVVRRACRDAARITELTGTEPLMSVNVSPRQLASADIVHVVKSNLESSQIDPSRLVLEITESAMMLDFDQAAGHLKRLKDVGVKLALDDFGAGYSSLNLFHRLPLDFLKLDRLFTRDVIANDAAAEVVRSIAEMSKAVGVTPLAEGVETEAEHDFIREAGFELAQGFYYARPAPFDEAVGLLNRAKIAR